MEVFLVATNSSITTGSPKKLKIDPACRIMDEAIEGSNSTTENEENCTKKKLDGSDDNLQCDSVADCVSDDELFNVSKRKMSKKSTVMSDDEEDSSSESRVLPDSRVASHDAKDNTDEDSDQECLSSNKHRIQRPVESDSDQESMPSNEVKDAAKVKVCVLPTIDLFQEIVTKCNVVAENDV